MSIKSDKSAQGQNLQDIIDGYNRELLRLHRQSREGSSPAPGDGMPAADGGGATAAVSAPARPDAALSESEQEQWMRDLEAGLEELRKGLIELAKGQKELSDGLREWREGIADAGIADAGLAAGASASPPYRYSAPASYNMPVPAAMPDGADARHMHGTMAAPSESPENDPIEDIVANPAGHGNLCVTVNAARQAVPIAGASVTVTLPISDYELLYSFVSTDGSGRSPEIELPVYEDSLSDHIPPSADSSSYTPEYRTYRVRVQAAGFRVRDDLTAEIFDGISSTLNVELEPLSGEPGSREGMSGGGES